MNVQDGASNECSTHHRSVLGNDVDDRGDRCVFSDGFGNNPQHRSETVTGENNSEAAIVDDNWQIVSKAKRGKRGNTNSSKKVRQKWMSQRAHS
jgi:hypothetical protein